MPAPILPVIHRLPGDLARPEDLGLDAFTALAVPIAPPGDGETEVQPRRGTADAAVLYRIDLGDYAVRESLTGKAGEVHVLSLPKPAGVDSTAERWAALPSRLVFVGVGDESPAALRTAGAQLARRLGQGERIATTVAAGMPADVVRALVEGFALGGYRIQRSGLTAKPADPAELTIVGRTPEQAVEQGLVSAEATIRVRDLANTPSNIKSPQWVVDRAREAVKGIRTVSVDVLGERELAAEGFGGILAVGSGSAYPSRLAIVRYTPEQEARHVVLVGKGITYDTGGLSIKPREAMVSMKTDMAGAATVLATVIGAAKLGLRHRVTAVLPLAENAFSGSSYRPGDVVTTYGGTTVEIANTDAEGRVVLADALAYADAQLDPDILVDIATLTGAAKIGLGLTTAALYATDDRVADGLVAAADASGERVWRMPLAEEYRPAIDSGIADLRHITADPHVGAGSVVAALFLQHFTGSRRWAHLDIAGPARSARDAAEVSEGATGFGARLLLRYLENLR